MAHEDNLLPVFDGLFNSWINLFKLYGSLDLYRFDVYQQFEGAPTYYSTPTHYYFKTRDYREKHFTNLINSDTGEVLQSMHIDTIPKFVTGVRKEELIVTDSMYVWADV